jgi:hypothetical protein
MWVFNVWLYLVFLFGGTQYDEMKTNGDTCYAWMQIEDTQSATPDSLPPVCFYDPGA